MNVTEEEWRDAAGWDGLYRVSSLGNVWSTRAGRPLTQTACPKGYRYVTLHRDGRKTNQTVHRLVAMTFSPAPPGLEVNHKDGDKANNRPENLEWCTHAENMAHALATGLFPKVWNPRIGQASHKAKLCDAQVYEIRSRYPGETIKALAALFDVSQASVSAIVHGKSWQHLLPNAGVRNEPKDPNHV